MTNPGGVSGVPVVDVAVAPQVPTTAEPLPLPSPAPAERPDVKLTPGQWIHQNLFASPFGAFLTILFGIVLTYLAFRLAWFVLVSSDWEIIRRNLRLFMIGRFPIDEVWRLWAALYVVAGLGGVFSAATVAEVERRAGAAGRQLERPGRWDWIRRYWPALAVVAVILAQTRTWAPTLLTLLGAAILVVGRVVGRRLPDLARFTWLGLLVGVLTVVQLMAGASTALSGLALGVLVATVVGAIVAFLYRAALRPSPDPAAGRRRVLITIAKVGGVVAALTTLQLVLEGTAGTGGVEWDDWGGLHLTLFMTVAGIALSFPLGVMVALGRRSSLPALRWITVTFIEVIRGVPLVTLLFLGHYVIPLFFPNTAEPPSPLARALIAITLFEAAYVAETVRGGLQSIPRGQYEAAQALGLRPWSMTRLIVLPQALRAVIPAMVGQFISLYKDTALLQIIGFTELLEVAENVVSQPRFLGQRLHTVTFAFAALIYWAGSYTMSRESRRLEQRLGLGPGARR